MAEKLERKVMEIYGENAATRDIIAYGSDIAGNIVETKDPDVIQTEAYKTGVRSAVVGNNSTTLQNRQALDFLFSRQLKYLYQHGIAEWGADETYYKSSVVKGSDGNLYGSITDNNEGHDPVTDTSHTYWRNFPTYQELNAKVNKAGDTMTGTLKMSGNNEVRFGTDDDFYYVKRNPNGDFNILIGITGFYLAAGDNYKPYYTNGTSGYRLLTTADLPGNAGSVGFPNLTAGITFPSTFTAPSDGWISAISTWIGQNDQIYNPFSVVINNVEVYAAAGASRDGRDGLTQDSFYAPLKAGDVVNIKRLKLGIFFPMK